MGKLISAVLIAATIAVAAVYLIRRRNISDADLSRARGWRRHVLIGAAMVLAIVGVGGCSGDSKSVGAGGHPPIQPEETIANNTSRVREAWRQADARPDPDDKDYAKFDAALKARLAAHDAAVDALVTAGTLEAETGAILKGALSSLTNSAEFRQGRVTCYDMSVEGGASVRAEGDLAKASAELARLAESAKLAPAVVEKARNQIARQLQIITIANQAGDPAVVKLAQAYLAGKPIDEPVPDEFVKAAEALARILSGQEDQ